MSSDSEASHSSAQRNHGAQTAVENPEHVPSVDYGSEAGEDTTSDNGPDDMQDEELQSMDNGSNGLTFARVRSRGAQQEEDQTASELSFRPRVERPGSPESTSTPDDTPSIQVPLLDYQIETITDVTRAPDCLLLVAVFRYHIAPCGRIDRPRYSPLSAASPPDYRPPRFPLHAHRPPLFCQHTLDSPRSLVIYSSKHKQTRRILHKHRGR
jgi:hypothetical protein